MTAQILTQSQLKSILHYDPDSGVFTWKKRIANRINIGDVAGTLSDEGYVIIQINKQRHRAHRLACLWMTGIFPPHETDHIDHVRDNNKWKNLRTVTHQENGKNMTLQKNNTSGVCGVFFHEINKKWRARIYVDKKLVNIGSFKNFDDAVIARKSAENKFNFHANHGA